MRSHSVTCHRTQVNTLPASTPARQLVARPYSMYLPRKVGRLSWPRWSFTYRDGLPAHGRESNSQPVDHESDALTTTPPSEWNRQMVIMFQHLLDNRWHRNFVCRRCDNGHRVTESACCDKRNKINGKRRSVGRSAWRHVHAQNSRFPPDWTVVGVHRSCRWHPLYLRQLIATTTFAVFRHGVRRNSLADRPLLVVEYRPVACRRITSTSPAITASSASAAEMCVPLKLVFDSTEIETNVTGKKVKVKADIHVALHGNPISELRDVTCHMGSHSVTCHLHKWTRPA